MNPEQLRLARHALGLTDGRRVSYRNRYLAPHEGMTLRHWRVLEHRGFARAGMRQAIGQWFFLTEAGAKAALQPGERLDPEDFPSVA